MYTMTCDHIYSIQLPQDSIGEDTNTLTIGHREINLRLIGELPPGWLALPECLKAPGRERYGLPSAGPASCNTDLLGTVCPLLQQGHGCYEVTNHFD